MKKKARRKLVARLIELNDRIVTLETAVKRSDGRTAIGKSRIERLESLIAKRDEIKAKLDEDENGTLVVVESEPVDLLPFEPEDDEVDEIKGDE